MCRAIVDASSLRLVVPGRIKRELPQQLTAGGIAPGDTVVLRVQITVASNARSGRAKVCAVTATSVSDTRASDTVKAKVTVT